MFVSDAAADGLPNPIRASRVAGYLLMRLARGLSSLGSLTSASIGRSGCLLVSTSPRDCSEVQSSCTIVGYASALALVDCDLVNTARMESNGIANTEDERA